MSINLIPEDALPKSSFLKKEFRRGAAIGVNANQTDTATGRTILLPTAQETDAAFIKTTRAKLGSESCRAIGRPWNTLCLSAHWSVSTYRARSRD